MLDLSSFGAFFAGAGPRTADVSRPHHGSTPQTGWTYKIGPRLPKMLTVPSTLQPMFFERSLVLALYRAELALSACAHNFFAPCKRAAVPVIVSTCLVVTHWLTIKDWLHH